MVSFDVINSNIFFPLQESEHLNINGSNLKSILSRRKFFLIIYPENMVVLEQRYISKNFM